MKRSVIIKIGILICTLFLVNIKNISSFIPLEPLPRIETNKNSYFMDEQILINATWDYYSQSSENMSVKLLFINESSENYSIYELLDNAIWINNCPSTNGCHFYNTSLNLNEISLNQTQISKIYWIVLVFFVYINDEPSNSMVDKYEKKIEIKKYSPLLYNNSTKISFEFDNYYKYTNEIVAFENPDKKYTGLVELFFYKNETEVIVSHFCVNLSGKFEIDFNNFNLTSIGNFSLIINISSNLQFLNHQINLLVEIIPCRIYPQMLNNSDQEIILFSPMIEFDFRLFNSKNISFTQEDIVWGVRANFNYQEIIFKDGIYKILFSNPNQVGNFSFSLWGSYPSYEIKNTTYAVHFKPKVLNLKLSLLNYSNENSIRLLLEETNQIKISQLNLNEFDLMVILNQTWIVVNSSLENILNSSCFFYEISWSQLKEFSKTENPPYYIFKVIFNGNEYITNSTSNSLEIPCPLYSDFKANTSYAYLNESIAFEFTGLDGDSICNFLWEFGDGTNSTERNPIHCYNFVGNFSVTLKIFNDKGNFDILLKENFIKIEQNFVPFSDFLISNSTLYVFSVIQFNFTGQLGNNPTIFFWDFGDGTNSSDINPVHFFQQIGIHNISLTVIDKDNDTSIHYMLVNIEMDLYPIANFSISSPFLFMSQEIQFNFTGQLGNNPTVFFWDFGDGTNSSERNPIHIYSEPGMINVKLKIRDQDMQESQILKVLNISIDFLPNGNISYENITFYTGDLVLFNFSGCFGNSPYLVFWDFGDGNFTQEDSPSNIYEYPGIFNVTLLITDHDGDCFSTTKTISIEQNLIPQASYNISKNNIVAGQSVDFQFNGLEGNGKNCFFWDFGDGKNSTERTPSHIYKFPGNFSITLTVIDQNSDKDQYLNSVPLCVSEDLHPSGYIHINTSKLIRNYSISFQALNVTGNLPISYCWDLGNGIFLYQETFSYSFNSSGVVNLTLTIVDFDLDVFLTNISFFINEDYFPNVSIRVNNSICIQGEYIEFSPIGNYGNHPSTFFWDFGDGSNSSDISPIHRYLDPGIFQASLIIIDWDGDEQNITTCMIQVNPDLLPIASFSTNSSLTVETQDILFFFTGFEGNGLQKMIWDFGDGNNSTEKNPVHRYLTQGNYSVSLNVFDIDGDQDFLIINRFIEVFPNLMPNASFTSNVSKIVSQTYVKFIFIGDLGNLPATIIWLVDQVIYSINKSEIIVFINDYNIDLNITLKIRDLNNEYDEIAIIFHVYYNLDKIKPYLTSTLGVLFIIGSFSFLKKQNIIKFRPKKRMGKKILI
ncbi:MAG: hypothetical protein DRO88_06855 [Promethearchaeia archaeon]|nr:MAG: hypothetical protein DRO88_06855 [Candidatus Lokiarchaeia archaeon]